MQYHKQRFRHRPEEGEFGDCHRTAIACVLDLQPDEVPNFGEAWGDADRFNSWCAEWLRARGYMLVQFGFNSVLDEVLNFMGHANPGAIYLLGGKSRSGCNHTVVCCGAKVIHDPSRNDSGIVAPCVEDDLYWVSVLVPTALTLKAA